MSKAMILSVVGMLGLALSLGGQFPVHASGEDVAPAPEAAEKGALDEAGYLKLVEAARPLLDQIHLNLVFADRDGKIIYVNQHAAASIKALAGLVGFDEIKTGHDVVGTNMAQWHRLDGFAEAMEEHQGQWGKWHIKGVRWRPRSDCVRDAQGNVIGYAGAWEELDQGPSAEDKTEETYAAAPYRTE